MIVKAPYFSLVNSMHLRASQGISSSFCLCIGENAEGAAEETEEQVELSRWYTSQVCVCVCTYLKPRSLMKL